MAFQSHFFEDYEAPLRARGERYANDGRVEIEHVADDFVRAVVRGGRPFAVEFEYNGDLFDIACDCSLGPPCEHAWAVGVMLDRKGCVPWFEGDVSPPLPWRERLASLEKRQRLAVQRRSGTHGTVLDRPYYLAHWDKAYRTILAVRAVVPDQRGRAGARYRPVQIDDFTPVVIPDRADDQAFQTLERLDHEYESYRRSRRKAEWSVPVDLAGQALQVLAATGRAILTDRPVDDAEMASVIASNERLEFDPDPFVVRIVTTVRDAMLEARATLSGATRSVLCRGSFRAHGSGFWIVGSSAGWYEPLDAFDWLDALVEAPLVLPEAEAGRLLETIYTAPSPPAVRLPRALSVAQFDGAPRPILFADIFEGRSQGTRIRLRLSFAYDTTPVAHGDARQAFFDRDERRLVRRDAEAERAAVETLRNAGAQHVTAGSVYAEECDAHDFHLLPKKLPALVRDLTAAGWRVEAEGVAYRPATGYSVSVSSGIDWFDLGGVAEFSGHEVPLGRVLTAMSKKETTVTLDDGSHGMIPEQWLERIARAAATAESVDDKLRFRGAQALLLDALLADEADATTDRAFDSYRRRLRAGETPAPKDAPKAFAGDLRAYQREGLGWLDFLRRQALGGCLADDMGLGKTVQVLAYLAGRKRKARTSLVVVPRSLVFNWTKEAERFAPRLDVLDQTGPQRVRDVEAFEAPDLVLTTYGTLVRDIRWMKAFTFDVAILDEAQWIKNERSTYAKAARLLGADQRLALTGTPVENHLGELWSLFEFLNPGLLGSASAYRKAAKDTDVEFVRTLSSALRPLILRRTKQLVADDLPERVERTVYCDLDPAHRKLYDDVRDGIRTTLTARIERDGLAKAKIHVLEALLRLRQIACHPSLVGEGGRTDGSAKIDQLIEQIDEVVAEGHKVLVFSQFTSLLAIVRRALDARKIVYEYLDGRTRRRDKKVERFQTDDACSAFLISLRAGGVGLNLTAADYVFLLDPWWNPAVEAQAIDRTHRIGQTQRVIATRLIARDTVEERVLELQASKRSLADNLLSGASATLRGMDVADLEQLLS